MEVLPRHYILGIVIFMFFIIGGITLINNFSNDNDDFLEADKYDKFNKTFNKLSIIDAKVDTLESGVKNANTDMGLFGVLNSLINSAWNTLKLLTESLNFMDTVFEGLSTIFGVPIWVSQVIIMIVTIIIVFAIYSAIFQREI